MTHAERCEEYWKLREQEFEQLELRPAGAVAVDQKLLSFDRNLRIERWQSDAHLFLVSRGCAVYPGEGERAHDEFLIQYESCRFDFALRLLTFVIYFHLTRRALLPADVLEIGDMDENVEGFTHVFLSVPFFLPGKVNFMSVEDHKFSLNWIMPIFQREAEFIEKHGVEEFEKRLNASGYDYFDTRTDFHYLTRQ